MARLAFISTLLIVALCSRIVAPLSEDGISARHSQEPTSATDEQKSTSSDGSWDPNVIKCRVCIAAIDDMWVEGSKLRDHCGITHRRKKEAWIRSRSESRSKELEEEEKKKSRSASASLSEGKKDSAKNDPLEVSEGMMEEGRDGSNSVSAANAAPSPSRSLSPSDIPNDEPWAYEYAHHYDEHADCHHDYLTHRRLQTMVSQVCDSLPDRHDYTHKHPKGGFRLTRVENRTQWDDGTTKIAVFTSIPLHSDEGRQAIIDVCKVQLYQGQGIPRIVNYLHSHLNTDEKKEKALPALRKIFCFDSCTKGTRRRGARQPKFQYHEDL